MGKPGLGESIRREAVMAEDVIGMTMEERLAALEKEVALMKMRLEQLTAPKGNWIEQTSGCMKGLEAEFAEAMRLSAEILRADQPPREP
jgi:hypothetical protein